jgi:DNA-binding transcriptional LysR family regulator
MILTPFAQSIVEPVRRLMLQIETTVGSGARFDPETATRKFTISASDYVTEVLLAGLVVEAAKSAPGVILEFVPSLENPAAPPEAGDIDLLITPDIFASPGHPSELLFEDEGWAKFTRPSVGLDSNAPKAASVPPSDTAETPSARTRRSRSILRHYRQTHRQPRPAESPCLRRRRRPR